MTKTKIFFNFRGTFGSGKSVVPLLMCKKSKKKELVYRAPNSNKVSHTILHDYKMVVVGSYENACGGVDGFIPWETALEAMSAAAKDAAQLGYDVIAEGVILSSTLSGSVAIFKAIEREYGFWIMPIYMDTPPERCLANIQHRNGGKALKDDSNVVKKWRQIWINQRPKMKETFSIRVFRTENVDTEGMLQRFLSLREFLKGD